jgi:sugar O-acyltransferase (sialic acid O-acetyltransferase NeuD family)
MMDNLIIIGAGGHARVLIATLRAMGCKVIGILDQLPDRIGQSICDIPIVGNDEDIPNYSTDSIELVNGIGSVSSMEKRRDAYLKFKRQGYSFATVIHPSAIVLEKVQLDEGVQIMAGAIVQTGCKIGVNSIINTGAVVDHDCIIGEHVHVASGAVLSGGVRVGAMTHIGTSATAIQYVEIGSEAVIGAGAVVVKNIPSKTKVLGQSATQPAMKE